MNGQITRVVPDRGFGFIKGDDGQDYFMHRSALLGAMIFGQLKAGQPVTFEATKGPKGLRAENVRLVEKGGA